MSYTSQANRYRYYYEEPIFSLNSEMERSAQNSRFARIEAQIQTENVLGRSRMEVILQQQKIVQIMLRKSRREMEIESELALQRQCLQIQLTQSTLWRSRRQADLAASESALEICKIKTQQILRQTEDSLRRSQNQAQVLCKKTQKQYNKRRNKVEEDVQRILSEY